MTTAAYRRLAVRAAGLSGALALLLAACGEPTEQPEQGAVPEQQQGTVPEQQQGAVTPESTDSSMLTGDDLGDANQGQQ